MLTGWSNHPILWEFFEQKVGCESIEIVKGIPFSEFLVVLSKEIGYKKKKEEEEKEYDDEYGYEVNEKDKRREELTERVINCLQSIEYNLCLNSSNLNFRIHSIVRERTFFKMMEIS